MSISENQIFIETQAVKVNPDYKNLVPKLNKEDDLNLDESIKIHGIREPLTFNRKNVLLDGHSRLEKAQKYKMKLVPKKVRHFDNPLEEEKYVIECNLQRRHLNSFQKVELGIPLIEIESQLAKQRQKANLKNNKSSLAPIEANDKKGKTVKKVSTKITVPPSTIERAKTIIEKGSDELKEKVRSGKTSINSAYQQVTKNTRNLPKVELSKGEFDVILCDVPIGFKDQGGRGAAENHYPTMTAQELSKLPIPSAKNAIMFFWMSPSIEKSIVDDKSVDQYPVYQYILDAWDFKTIKGEFVWDKEIIGLGSWNRNQHENCLIAIKGKMPCPAELFSSIIKEKRTNHSKKPEIFYSMIEKMYPGRKYLELFGREKRKNWTVFGNEVDGKTPSKQTKTICSICWNYHNSTLVKAKNKYIDFNTKAKQKQHLKKEHTEKGNLKDLPYTFDNYFVNVTLEKIEENKKKINFLDEEEKAQKKQQSKPKEKKN